MVLLAIIALDDVADAQPNPYREAERFYPPKNMNGGQWGEVIGVEPDHRLRASEG